MRVAIDGIEYAPVSERQGRIGIAVTTHNRPDLLRQALDAHRKHLPEGAVFVVVDDGSTPPAQVSDWFRLIRHDQPQGIARAKNACLAALMDAGCDHLFLFDDDIWPVQDNWHLPYIASPEPHLMLLWGDEYFRTVDLVACPWPKGLMLYAQRRVVDRIGGMDPAFGRWGCEHMQWSDRIHNVGLTTCRYQDVPGSEALFKALDRNGEVQSSVPLDIRVQANTQAAIDGRYSDAFIPLRGEAAEKGVALSVLVPSVGSRRSTFAPKIMDQLFGQHEALPPADQKRVEILMLTDAKGIVLGDKRNAMIRMAQGEYVVFVDDDDRIEPDYLRALLDATTKGADCITFHASVSINGAAPKVCRYSTRYQKDENTATEYHRLPNHICAIRRDIALRSPFPAKLKGEDADFAVLVRPLLKSEHDIGRVLYHYDYCEATTETQRKVELEPFKAPEVDVVVLSKASTDALRAMTQTTIDTCLRNAGQHPVSVVVIEQVPGVRYRDAVTLTETGAFAYNAFANRGIRTGKAPWVMVANSDLEFQPGWLEALLAVRHDVVSPIDPGHSIQESITRNETGTTNGRHFSGWCFMLKRSLWEKIGGLDDAFRFWAADDSVIEQVNAAGVQPMIVPAARVKHKVSATAGDMARASGDDGSMTWAQIYLFEQKYGKRKFENDPRYAAWKRKNGK